MQQLEELCTGAATVCGTFEHDEAEIVAFAQVYDPQPFHLEHEAARHSIFGQLTGSGLHAASSARRLVLQSVMSRVRFLGSPGALGMQMHSPLLPGRRITVTHTFDSFTPLPHYPGIVLVACTTQGVDASGVLIITLRDLQWLGTSELPEDFDAAPLQRDASAAPQLGPFVTGVGGDADPDTSKVIDHEGCRPGVAFRSAPSLVTAEEDASFSREFDVRHESGALLRNEWYGPGLTMHAMAPAFWLRSRNVGGPGVENVRWPLRPRPGDSVRGEMKVLRARPLRSRPHLGLATFACACINQQGEPVSSYEVTAFFERSNPAIQASGT